MKIRKQLKKITAFICAITLVITGITYCPEKVSAGTAKIAVTNVPATDGGTKAKYRLGTTSDSSADGEWYLQVSNNQWANWTGSYQNADGIEGFIFYNEVYNNRGGGISLWSTDLKSEYNLNAGTTYTMTATITYADVYASQTNTLSTEGGTTNMNVTETVAAGSSVVEYQGTVTPSANDDLVLKIFYSRGSSCEVGTLTVTDITFSEYVPETLPPNYYSVTAPAGGSAVEGTEGFWDYVVIPGTGAGGGYTWDVSATFGACNTVDGFTATLDKYCWAGSFWKVNDMKVACKDSDNNALEEGESYTCTITITETPDGNIHTPMTIITTGGITNLEKETKTSQAGEALIWTGTVVPGSGALTLTIGYGNNAGSGGLDGQAGSFTVNSVVFEKEETTTDPNYYRAVAPAGGAASGSAGLWNYILISGDDGAGSTWDVSADMGPINTIDGFRAEIGQYSWDGSYWNASDLKQVYGLIAGNTYSCTVRVRPLSSENVVMHVSTSGGSANLVSSERTGKSGDTLTWSGTVVPQVAPLQLDIGYGNSSAGEPMDGFAGGFEVVDVTFTLLNDISTACTIGSQATAGVWTYTVAQNGDNNQVSSYENTSTVDGFVYNQVTASETGANWSATDLKSIYNLTEGKTYTCTVTLKPYCHYETNFHVSTTGGTTNLADTDKTGTAMAKLTWTGEVVPSGSALTLNIGYGNNVSGNGTGAQIGGFRVESVTFTEKKLVPPKSVAAYNFYVTDGGYQLIYVPVYDDVVSYNLYIDNVATPLKNIAVADCSQIDSKKNVWSVNENLAPSLFASYANDAIHNLYLTAIDSHGNESAKSKAAPVRITSAAARTAVNSHPTDISRVYITTNTATDIDSLQKADSKQDAALSIISADTSIIKNATYYGTVKQRGNSTAMADKKAYNISFNTKQKVMTNASKGKKWSLLANAYEKTMMRNKLGMDFGLMLGKADTPEEHYVDVYMNGTYKGTYVLSEPAENGRCGVDYDEDADDVLFEYEGERDETGPDGGVAYFTTSRYRMRFVIEEFEDEVNEIFEDGASTAELIMNYMRRYNPKFMKWCQTLDDFENALRKTSTTDYRSFIDEDSFVDMYIVNELFKTLDFTYSSVKFYVTYDEQTGAPTIHAGPLWDFDLSSGNIADNYNMGLRDYDESPLRGQENKWFGALMKNPAFVEKVKARYQALQPQIQNLYVDNYLGTNKIDQNYEEMEASRIRNYTAKANGGAGWSESTPDSYEHTYAYGYSTISPYSSYTYDEHVEYLRDWLQNRNEYLVETWGLSLEYDIPTDIITCDDIAVEGFQIRTNEHTAQSVAYRTVCKAPKIDSTIKVGGVTYTVKQVGTVYAVDPTNNTGDNARNSLTTAYTELNPEAVSNQQYKYIGRNTINNGAANPTYGYIGSTNAILSSYKPSDTTHNYYAFTMENMESAMAYTLLVRAFIVAKDGSNNDVLIYGPSTAMTSVAEIADYLYTNSYSNNSAGHDYLYTAILNDNRTSTSRFHRTSRLEYGWDNNLYYARNGT